MRLGKFDTPATLNRMGDYQPPLFAAETGRVATHDQATLRKLLERLHT